MAISQLIFVIFFVVWRQFAKLRESQNADDADGDQSRKNKQDAEKLAKLLQKCEVA